MALTASRKIGQLLLHTLGVPHGHGASLWSSRRIVVKAWVGNGCDSGLGNCGNEGVNSRYEGGLAARTRVTRRWVKDGMNRIDAPLKRHPPLFKSGRRDLFQFLAQYKKSESGCGTFGPARDL
jgi:hypothetical protein